MKKLDFVTSAGWPGSYDTWKYLQEMIVDLEKLSYIGGTNYIVKGCVNNAGIVEPGIIVINGEVLPFEGGALQDYVIVVDETVTREYFGGAINPYYHNRKATFGIGVGQVAWADITKPDPNKGVLQRLDKIEKMLKPLLGYTVAGNTVYGSWMFWGRPADEIPEGWEPVPDADWKGKFPVVMNDGDVDFQAVGLTGGQKEVTLTGGQQGKLKINVKNDDIGGGAISVVAQLKINDTVIANNGASNQTAYGGDQFVNARDAEAAHTNLPPYKVVMFIRFVG